MSDAVIHINFDDHGLPEQMRSKERARRMMIGKMLSDITGIYWRWSQNEAPFKTGKLRRNILHEYGQFHGTVFVEAENAPYFEYVIDGTRPHIIVPKNKQALWWEGAQYPVKKVKHPGTKGQPFFDEAIVNANPEVERRIEIFEEWLERY